VRDLGHVEPRQPAASLPSRLDGRRGPLAFAAVGESIDHDVQDALFGCH
jgi:hypothetical protein